MINPLQRISSIPFNFNSLDHTHYMREALKEAELALLTGEYAIGAVITHNGVIVGRGLCRPNNVLALKKCQDKHQKQQQ